MFYHPESNTINVDKSRFHGNSPSASRASFCVRKGKLRVTEEGGLKADYTGLSRAGNGNVTFHDIAPGVYVIDGALADNKGNTKSYILVINSDDEEGYESFGMRRIEEAATFAGFNFEDEINAQQKVLERLDSTAEGVLQEIQNERKEHTEEDIEGVTATPEFAELPTKGEIIKSLQGEGYDENAYIVLHGSPMHYIVTTPVFAKASTAEAAVADAKQRAKEREQSKQKAAAEADAQGLPELKGTPRQVAWAIQIRADHASKNPDSSKLKRATTAKYWIDNRNSL